MADYRLRKRHETLKIEAFGCRKHKKKILFIVSVISVIFFCCFAHSSDGILNQNHKENIMNL